MISATWETAFAAVNAVSLLSWLALIGLPRSAGLMRAVRFGVIGLLSVAYVVLVAGYFFRVEGGGYFTLAEVKRLFSSDPVVLAGWLHVTAFDLFVGVWIAEQLDAIKTSRWVQAPVLAATFMLGPLGMLMAYALGAGRSGAQSKDVA